MLDKYYQPDLVEEKIYKQWEEDGDFKAPTDSKNKHYSIVIPPPNVTGNLHMGHALNNTLQDILIRFYRMKGRDVLWQPGTDHAGIATEMVVERELKKQEIKKANLSREEFIEHVWKWKDSSGNKIRKINPKYVFIENVPQQLKTFINYKDRSMLIPEYLKFALRDKYSFNDNEIINAADYGIPQSRTRSIILLTRKDLEYKWLTPRKKNKISTLKDAIGDLPSLDPLIYDISYKDHMEIFPEYEKKAEIAKLISKWHYPPKHVYRQVISMIYTKTGKSAFENIKKYKPKKIDGTYVKGFNNTYKRQSWDKPGYTITTFNRTISSQENVHPGRKIRGSSKYSDPRVFTIYEIMKVMTIPTKWRVPSWCSENFLRTVIGEGIPPLLVKIFFQELIRIHKKNEK